MNRILRTLIACLLALALLGTASAVAAQTEFNIISAISALSGGYGQPRPERHAGADGHQG